MSRTSKLILASGVLLILGAYWKLPLHPRSPRNAHGDVGVPDVTNDVTDVTNVTTRVQEGFRDITFAPLFEAYRKTGRETTGMSFRSGDIPRFLLWSDPLQMDLWNAQLEDITSGLCPLPCAYTFELRELTKVDAVVVYLRGISAKSHPQQILAPRDPRQPWVVLNFEPPMKANKAFRRNFRSLNGVFNRTMVYRRDADVVVPHGFVVENGPDVDLLPKQWHTSPLTPTIKSPAKLAAAFISNCRDASGRLQYIRELKKYISVDIYGRCGRLKCGRSMFAKMAYDPTEDNCFKMVGMSYMFYFAFENSLCKDYVTEKPYNFLYYPLVLVVYGAADYASVLPPNSYIDARKYKPIQLAKLLSRLAATPEEYQKYHEWRQHYRVSIWGGERSMCHLCVRLHDPEFYREQVVTDFQHWFVSESGC